MALYATFTDTFATQDATKWVYASGVTATGGVASLIPDATFNRNIHSVNDYDFAGSFIIAEVVTIGSCQVLSMNAAFASPGNNQIQIAYDFGNLRMTEVVAGVSDSTTITYNATTHRWWAMRESGGVIYWYTLNNGGSTWTLQRTKTRVISNISTSGFGVDVTAYTASGTTPAQVDNFNLPSVALPSLTAPASTGFLAMM